MNIKIRIAATFAFVALTIGLFSSPQATSAVGVCHKAKGNLNIVNNGNGTASGIITQGGQLNGTNQVVFTSMFTATPDPTTFSFTDDESITTYHNGVLKTHNVAIFDMGTGGFTAIARIDPNTSTGNFAGSTGVLYINGRSTDGGATLQAEITGEICSAN